MTTGKKNLGFAFFQKVATFMIQYYQKDFFLQTKIYMQREKQNNWGFFIKIQVGKNKSM